MICSFHTQGESGTPGEKGDRGERGEPVCISLKGHFCGCGAPQSLTEGLLLQGQQGVAGTAGMKGQKVSHAGGRCHIRLLPLFVPPASRLAWRRGGEAGAAQAELYP